MFGITRLAEWQNFQYAPNNHKAMNRKKKKTLEFRFTIGSENVEIDCIHFFLFLYRFRLAQSK